MKTADGKNVFEGMAVVILVPERRPNLRAMRPRRPPEVMLGRVTTVLKTRYHVECYPGLYGHPPPLKTFGKFGSILHSSEKAKCYSGQKIQQWCSACGGCWKGEK